MKMSSTSTTSGTQPRHCPCHTLPEASPTSSSPLCPACVEKYLEPHLLKRREALLRHAETKDWARRQLTRIHGEAGRDKGDTVSDLSRLQDESEALRERLDTLRRECAAKAVRLASVAVRNDERAEALRADRVEVDAARGALGRLHGAVCALSVEKPEGSGDLSDSIREGTDEVRRLRFRLACDVFEMHRLDIGGEQLERKSASEGGQDGAASTRERILGRIPRGVGKIGGLPLPHAGPALYGVLPPNVLSSSLRLVASLTSTVARCLGIMLPHPILLLPEGGGGGQREREGKGLSDQHGDIASTVPPSILSNPWSWPHDGGDSGIHHIDEQQPKNNATSSSTSSLLSLVGSSSSILGRSARKALALATGHPHHHHHGHHQDEGCRDHVTPPPPMDGASVSRRLRHASAAVVAESSTSHGVKGATQYALVPPRHDATAGPGGPHEPAPAGGTTRTQAKSFGAPSDDIFDQYGNDAGWEEEMFAVGLQLLQNDVVALCIGAGVPVECLWPAEALLLNLESLRVYCAGWLDDAAATRTG